MPNDTPATEKPAVLKCTINGQELEVKPGTSIMEAMKQSGQDIAHYCWHPGLSVAGVCRLCMVEIEGNPRLQIACNTAITEGMKASNNTPKVQDAVKWGLDLHLINHPLDCPICDQAGECGLQDQYMKFGKYDPEMAERKQKKHKVVDLGPRVVLDSERCVLCSRCVRFTDEVTKTSELGIFNRGDKAEIGCVPGKPLDNNYSLNTVDICPVGALTSKDFRFRQRVWFLKEHKTICTGCSTGCNTTVSYNKDGVFRIKPRYNEQVNGYWMTDSGRDAYKFINRPARLLDARIPAGQNEVQPQYVLATVAAKKAGEALRSGNKSSTAVVVTGQHTVEEYEAFIGFFKKELGIDRIYHWKNNPEEWDNFDGLLARGDKNPNTKGLEEVLAANGIKTEWKDLIDGLSKGAIQTVVVAGPENQFVYPDMKSKISELSKASKLIWFTAGKNDQLELLSGDVTLIPLKTYVEKGGTFVNYAGLRQRVERGFTVVPNSLSLTEAAELMAGRDVLPEQARNKVGFGRIANEALATRGSL